jgi:hypothetical protein
LFWFFYLFKNFYFVSDVAVDETRDTSKDENSKTESHTNEQIMKSDRLSDSKVIENACEEHVNHQTGDLLLVGDSILESLSEFSL